LLIAVERRGRIGVVELAELVGRDYTTVSRQVARLDSLGLIARRPSKTDSRVREAVIAAKGKEITSAIDEARERMAGVVCKVEQKGPSKLGATHAAVCRRPPVNARTET